jgi:hypothetical protein
MAKKVDKKLDRMLDKFGLSVSTKPAKKSSLEVLAGVPATIISKVSEFILANLKISELTARLEELTADIREYCDKLIISTKAIKNAAIEVDEGGISVVYKDQFSCKDATELKAWLVRKKIKPDEYVTEEQELSFAFDKMTPAEVNAFGKFLSKEFGEARFKELATSVTKIKISGLKDAMPELCKNYDELVELRQVSGHFRASVSVRKEKE